VLEAGGAVRIAVIAPLVTAIAEPQLGGSQALVSDLAVALTERGHDIVVFAASGSSIPGVTVVDTGIDPAELQPSLYRIDAPEPDPRPAAWAFGRVVELIRAERFDVVHVHAFDAPAVGATGALEIPVIHTVHLPPDRAVLRALAEASTGPRPPAVVTVSAFQRRQWSAAGVSSTLIPNGVPVPRIPWSARPSGFALFAGRLTREKGPDDAIRIARQAGVPVVVAGGSYDPGFAGELAAATRGVAGVELLGSLPRAELWTLMARAAALLCPIHWDEPFGLTAAEAQAAGTPVIGYRRGALPEVVAEGVTGALVPEGDVAAAASALRQVAAFDRSECRRHAERHLDLERTVDGYERLSAAVATARVAT